jgi:hypothetical protein
MSWIPCKVERRCVTWIPLGFAVHFGNLDITTRYSVTIDGVWIGNRIYWTLTLVTTNNYNSLTGLHAPKIAVIIEHKVFSVFNTRCLVAASNGGRSPSSGSLNSLRIWGPRSNFCYCRTVAGLFMWGGFSDERMGLSFAIAAGTRQRSHSPRSKTVVHIYIYNFTCRHSI